MILYALWSISYFFTHFTDVSAANLTILNWEKNKWKMSLKSFSIWSFNLAFRILIEVKFFSSEQKFLISTCEFHPILDYGLKSKWFVLVKISWAYYNSNWVFIRIWWSFYICCKIVRIVNAWTNVLCDRRTEFCQRLRLTEIIYRR